MALRFADVPELGRSDVASAVSAMTRAGLGALTVPESSGGLGADLPTLFDFLVDLGAIDPNISHAVGNHFNFVDSVRLHHDRQLIKRVDAEAVAGNLFTVCAAESGTTTAGTSRGDTVVKPDTDGTYLLSGTKSYTTGSIFAHRLAVRAQTVDARPRTALVDVAAPGVEVHDDWSAFGQRHTGSGTVTFDNVRLVPGDVVDFSVDAVGGLLPYRGGFTQLVLLASAAGVASRIHSDTIELVRKRGRNFDHALDERPTHDAIVQTVVGELSSIAWVLRVLVRAAAQSFAARPDPTGQMANYLVGAHRASADISRAKSIIDRLSNHASSRMFDAGSASSVDHSRALDRHWRNLRTLASHNPKEYRERAIGDFELNGTMLPTNGFF
ncbi:hypothetical protein ACXPWS_15815 [Mycobacterium sp. BMJ-28]